MSVRTDVINLNVNVNGNKALNEMNNLRKRAADIKFEMEGLKKGTKEYIAQKEQLKQVTSAMNALKKEIGIAALTQKELVKELSSLKALRGSVTPFSDEYKKLSASIKQVEDRLYNVKNGVQGFSSFMSKIKDEVKQFGVVAAGYLGFQFITTQFKNIISNSGKLSDSLADIQRVTGATAGEVQNLNSRLTKLDTRTSTQGLREIAIIAGKLGVAKDEILKFTAATDQLVVALGDELGNADQITTQLGKILNVFDGKVTGDNISRLGNAMVELANAGVASGGFIADFTQRVAAIAKSAGLGLGEVTGLAAAMEELGIRSESGSTAVQKLLSTIAADLPKAAKIAGTSTKEFTELFAKTPGEALLKFAEGLSKNKSSFAEVSAAFKDAGEEGARVVTVLSTLGQRGDFVREKMQQGSAAIKETTAITEAFALKNETLGATIDKLGKEFNRLISSSGVSGFVKELIQGAIALVRWFKELPTFIEQNRVKLILLAAATAIYNRELIVSTVALVRKRAAMILDTAATVLYTTATNAARIATLLFAAAKAVLTGNITRAGAAMKLLGQIFKATPWGVVLTAALALGAALDALLNKTKKLSAEQKANNLVAEKYNDELGNQERAIERLRKIATDETLTLSTRKLALQELIKINPAYRQALNGEAIDIGKVNAVSQSYLTTLRAVASAKARAAASDELAKNIALKDVEIYKQEQKALNEKESGPSVRGFFNFIGNGLKHEKTILADLQEERKALVDQQNFLLTGTENQVKQLDTQIETLTNQLKKVKKEYQNTDQTLSLRNQLNEAIRLRNVLIGGSTPDFGFTDEVKPPGNTTPPGEPTDKKYDKLKKEAEKFFNDLQRLKERAQIKGEEPEQREIDAVEAKYRELTQRAKELYLDGLNDKKKYSAAELLIEEAKQQELNDIFQKYFKQRTDAQAAGEYDTAIASWREYINDKKELTAQDYANGLIDQQQYSDEIVGLNLQEKQNLVLIAQDYAGTVKKAANDVKKFQKDADKEATDNAIKELERRKEYQDREKLAGAELGVYRTRPGSNAELDARKNLLQVRFDLETQYMDKTSNMYLTREAQLNEERAELERQARDRKIERIMEFVGYFQSALDSLEQYQRNKEQKQLNTEKQANDAKKASFKKQLDGKLISKAQYDRKVEQADAELDSRVKEIAREQAKREKALNIFNAVINTAGAIVKALNSPVGYPAAIALAAAAGIAGALQIAAISNTPLPELGSGYWLKTGPKHREAGKGTTVRIERDEAVMSAAAMTDSNRYSVSGTAAQITSALNSRNGGASWATGASVGISPDMPRIMEQGGYARPLPGDNDGTAPGESIATLEELRNIRVQLQQNNEVISNWKLNSKAWVSIKEYREEETLYDNAQKASGL